MKKIKVGMIRCDTHAAWYAPLMDDIDEMALLKYWPQCQYYFYYWRKAKFEKIEGFEITKLFNVQPFERGAFEAEAGEKGTDELLKEVLMGRPEICKNLEDVSEDVDLVFIADCNGEGKDHLKLAVPGLKKGIPTFVDKPFANTYQDVKSMIELAESNNTAVMSASLLRFNPLIDKFKQRFAEIEPIGEGFVKGVGPGLNAVIHNLSLAQHSFGEGVEWVDCMGRYEHEIIRLHYQKQDAPENSLDVIVRCGTTHGPSCGAQVTVYGHRTGSIQSPWINDYNFPLGGQVIVRKIKEMVKSGKPQVPYDSLKELFKTVDAARISRDEKRPVYLNEID